MTGWRPQTVGSAAAGAWSVPRLLPPLYLLLLCLLISACGTAERHRAPAAATMVGTPMSAPKVLGLPAMPVPLENPLTLEKVALGRRLYYDPILSADRTIACASCHDPAKGFADGRRTAVGVGGQTGNRSAPTVLNAAFSRTQFWDGRAPDLEVQAGGPIANPIEMNLPHSTAIERLQADAGYRAAFAAAFGSQSLISIEHVQQALASFERTVVSGNSPFDRYRYGGDRTTLSPEAQRGWAVFTGAQKGNCAACHLVGDQQALFMDGLFHNIGIGANGEGKLSDLGRYAQTKQEADRGAFKTPTLRHIAATAPYMHDGSLKTLRQVVDYYVGGGNANPQLDRRIRPLELTGQERQDLVAFLESLTGTLPADTGAPEAITAATSTPSKQ